MALPFGRSKASRIFTKVLALALVLLLSYRMQEDLRGLICQQILEDNEDTSELPVDLQPPEICIGTPSALILHFDVFLLMLILFQPLCRIKVEGLLVNLVAPNWPRRIWYLNVYFSRRLLQTTL